MKKVFAFFVCLAIIFTLVGCQNEEHILSSYDKKECYYEDGFRDYTHYCKYYYNEQTIKQYEKQSHFKKVTADNINLLRERLITYNDYVDSQKYFDKYDFNYKEQIKTGDLFCLIDKSDPSSFDLYYVDFDKCIVYYFHNNT
ncbi:MAG: hypothetical protein IKL44_02195 [Clostridia bacterium]|nr:hypothetical protein [Clostridia bacterium]